MGEPDSLLLNDLQTRKLSVPANATMLRRGDFMAESNRKSVTLVLGGARSGKSRFAQQLAARADKVTFFATACASDDEMRRKIERHRSERPAT